MDMKNEADIPCAQCSLWDAKAKSFSCNPNRCGRLSNWLLQNAQNHATQIQTEQVQPQIQYVV